MTCFDHTLSSDPHSWTVLNDLVAAERLDAVVVAIGGDELNLSVASHVRSRLDRDKQLTTPVFVEVRQNPPPRRIHFSNSSTSGLCDRGSFPSVTSRT